MDERQTKQLLDDVHRIAHAVEALAKKADPDFKPSEGKLQDLLKNPATKK